MPLLVLPLIGSQIHALLALVLLQIFILNLLPAVPPGFAVLRIIPVVHVFTVAFPAARGKWDTISVAVQIVNRNVAKALNYEFVDLAGLI